MLHFRVVVVRQTRLRAHVVLPAVLAMAEVV